MRVFVAPASGARGSPLVPQLIDQGNELIGTHNSPLEPAAAARAAAASATDHTSPRDDGAFNFSEIK